MSGSPTFDTEKKRKKNRNGGILRLRLAYGRRSNYSKIFEKFILKNSKINKLNSTIHNTSFKSENIIKYRYKNVQYIFVNCNLSLKKHQRNSI